MKLAGVKVLDLSAFLPGPHLTMMMADHGADVIMVEPANGVGEPVREIGEKTADGVSVWLRNVARGKRSLKLNLKDPDGLSLLLKLAEAADVFVEAFRPGVMTRLGAGYAAVRARNPRIVYCSISAFGQTGALAQKPAHDLVIQAMTGLMDLGRGRLDDQPAAPGIPFADAASSMLALSGILMALYRREQTGEGDYLDISMHDAALSWTPNVLGPVFGEGRAPVPKSMRSFGGAAMNAIYETADGKFLVIGGSEVKFAENLLTALGRVDLLGFAKLPPGDGQAPLKAFFRETFAANTLAHWEAFLAPVDCCWSAVRDLKQAFDDPFTAGRGMVFTDRAGNRHVGVPIRFQREPTIPDPAVPGFGADSEAIAREAGLDPAQIAALKAKGTL
jgi:crotonobetainyl-CoA:carnitine CoA-transferase CaiB-like acyl-CoA transferase